MTDAEFISAVAAAYVLTREDVTTLAEAIQKARLAIMQVSYRYAQQIAGLKPNWTPTKAVRRRVEKQSFEDARGIARTYQNLLRSFIEKVLAGGLDLFGDMATAIQETIGNVAQWLKDLLGWKSDQITNVSCGSGVSDGTLQFVGDVLEARDGDGVITDDEGEATIDLSEMRDIDEIGVQVVPGTSSSDLCKDYAGNTYSMEDFLSLGIQFPAHPFCRHSCVIVSMT